MRAMAEDLKSLSISRVLKAAFKPSSIQASFPRILRVATPDSERQAYSTTLYFSVRFQHLDETGWRADSLGNCTGCGSRRRPETVRCERVAEAIVECWENDVQASVTAGHAEKQS